MAIGDSHRVADACVPCGQRLKALSFPRKKTLSRTVADVKVFGGQLRAQVVEQRLAVEADHHGALVHVQQAAHHVAPLPGTAQRLAPLVVPLGLEGLEEGVRRESLLMYAHRRQPDLSVLRPPHRQTFFTAAIGFFPVQNDFPAA